MDLPFVYRVDRGIFGISVLPQIAADGRLLYSGELRVCTSDSPWSTEARPAKIIIDVCHIWYYYYVTVPKSSEAEQAQRVNATMQLIEKKASGSEVLREIISRYGLSRRQAYRYLQLAQQASAPLAVPDQKNVFTVKLPRPLIVQVRRQARQERTSISAWVEQALRLRLGQSKSHG